MRLANLAGSAALLALVGCFNPKLPDVTFACGPGGDCPAGYECRADGCCHKIGSPDNDATTCVAAAGDATTPDSQVDAAPDAGTGINLVTFEPANSLVTAGDPVFLTVTIDQVAPAPGVEIAFTSDATSVATVDATALVATGNTNTTVNVATIAAGGAVITAALAGQTLDATVTVASTTAGAGDIVINEFLAVTTAEGEFVELINVSGTAFDLNGWTLELGVNGSAGIVAASLDPAQSIYLAPGAIIYGVPNPADPANIPVDAAFVYGAAGGANDLADGGDSVTLSDGATNVDVVDFTSFVTAAGATPGLTDFAGLADRSTQLDASMQDGAANDDGAAWCVPASTTPGQQNAACGAIAINEAVVDAFGADSGLEFVELRAVPGSDLNAVGLRSTADTGVPTGVDIVFPAGTRVPLDGLFVVGDNTGGPTQVANADFETALGLPDTDGGLQLYSPAVTILDAVGWGTLVGSVDTVDGLPIVEGTATTAAEGSSLARNPLGTDSGDNSVDFHLDPSPTPGVENDTVTVSLTSVNPPDGLATASAQVTLSGADFVSGAGVTVDGVGATCNVVADDTIDCTFPDHGGVVAQVDVDVTNPGTGSDTLIGGFTYTGVLADPGASFFCNVQFPVSTTTTTGVATADIFGQLFIQGSTDATDVPFPGILGQLGWGADGADPTAVNFGWSAAAPNPGYDFSQSNDEYVGTLTLMSAGSFDYAYRFSDDGGLNWYYCDTNGSDDGYSPAMAGDLTVN